MTLEQAESFLQQYQELLAEPGKRGARRSPSLLPTTKDNLLRAIRLLIARLYYQSADDENALRPLIQAAMFLDSFNDQALDSLEFVEAMNTRRRQILEFYQELLNVQRTDPFFWQRVYALTGISCETKRTTFFESIRQRLGLAPRTETDTTFLSIPQ